MRASVYVRISSDREGAGLGVAAQEADCRELAESHGYDVVSVHTDNDISAYSGKLRRGYRALLDEIEADAIDIVLVWHTDRLHRSVSELEQYAQLCADHNVTTLTVKAGPIDLSNPSALLVARVLGSVARYEVDHMIERQQRAKLRSAQAGKWKGGRRPFGYEADGITVRTSEAGHIREGIAAVLAGESVNSITRRWNDAGARTTTGKAWDMTGVRRTLLRPRNAGLMEHQGQVIGSAEWPALVDEQTWRAAVHVLENPKRRTTTGSARKWLGSGIYRCGVCGETVITTTSGKLRSYKCRAAHVVRNRAEVDDWVAGHVVARLRRPDARNALLASTDSTGDEQALTERVVQLRARLDELAGLFAEGSIDGAQLASGSADLRERLQEAEDDVSALTAGTALAGIADASDPGEAWLNASLGQQRAVLDLLVSVTLHKSGKGRPPGWSPGDSYFRPETVQIEWKGTK